ncbi:NAD kinase [bacterium SCSIO 12741]|nr:NAD kinase [bacterium SCSIO 12741]
MKRVAIYGRLFQDQHIPYIQELFDELNRRGVELLIYDPFFDYLKARIQLPDHAGTFIHSKQLIEFADILLSVGGDGTILDSATLVKDSGIPVAGINTGRLGFLSTIRGEGINEALAMIFDGEFYYDDRTMIALNTNQDLFGDVHFALNELVVHKKDTSAMISIHTYLDDEFLNTYWADGLIISTPTGSTAYSLSCGGPIIQPNSANFVITPVAPHNLNSRPFVIPDHKKIRLKVEGRSKYFLVSLDSRMETIDSNMELVIEKYPAKMRLLRLNGQTFLKTISNKLHWGLDQRN